MLSTLLVVVADPKDRTLVRHSPPGRIKRPGVRGRMVRASLFGGATIPGYFFGALDHSLIKVLCWQQPMKSV